VLIPADFRNGPANSGADRISQQIQPIKGRTDRQPRQFGMLPAQAAHQVKVLGQFGQERKGQGTNEQNRQSDGAPRSNKVTNQYNDQNITEKIPHKPIVEKRTDDDFDQQDGDKNGERSAIEAPGFLWGHWWLLPDWAWEMLIKNAIK
jgi:hypothetical protein